MKKSFTKQNTVKKLASYSTFASAFLMLGNTSNAQIIYTDIPDETVGTGDAYDLDMNDDGDIDFTITNASVVFTDFFVTNVAGTVFYDGLLNFLQIYPASGNAVDAYVQTFPMGSTAVYPSVLNDGADIGPSGDFEEKSFQFLAIYESVIGYGSMSTTAYFYGFGAWPNKDGKFLGVRFSADGDDYYGWVRLTTSDFEVTIEDFAYYASPDAEISAGDMPTAIQSSISEEQLNAYSFGNTINIIVKDVALEGASVKVFNIDGQNIYNGNLNMNGMNIALENASTGNYTLQVTTSTNDVYARQFYIQN